MEEENKAEEEPAPEETPENPEKPEEPTPEGEAPEAEGEASAQQEEAAAPEGASTTVEDNEKPGTSERDSKDESLSQTKEEKRLSLEYSEILIEISNQNKVLNELKQRLIDLAAQPSDRCTLSEIRAIRCCLEEEKIKLNCLVQKAMDFQQEHPSGPWDDISLETNISEDCMPSSENRVLCTAMCNRIGATRKKTLGE